MNLGPHDGGLFEVRVIEADSGRLVGRWVTNNLNLQSNDITLTIPGIIKDGTEYQVDFFADLNDNQAYDAPPDDHAWREMVTGDGSGATVSFNHNTNFTDVQFGDIGGPF